MKLATRFENTSTRWSVDMPKLPKAACLWLVENGWRLSLLAAIGCAVAVFAIVPAAIASLVLASKFPLVPYAMYYSDSPSTLWIILSLDTISFIITAFLLGFAVMPMKNKKRQGWILVFRAYMVNVITTAICLVIAVNALNILFVVPMIIGGYLLRETRVYFKK
jgi:hypothetical protein